jgi:hypothetical protein
MIPRPVPLVLGYSGSSHPARPEPSPGATSNVGSEYFIALRRNVLKQSNCGV